jgi:hypothetical protein
MSRCFCDTRFRTERLFQERFSHRRDVLVRKTDVRYREQSIARFHCFDADLACGNKGVFGDDLFDNRHRATRPTR